AAAQAALVTPKQKEGEVRELLNKGFEQFEDFAYEFNQSALGTNLIVTVIRPTMKYIKVPDSELTAEYSSDGRVTVHEGSISTRDWVLILRGRYDRIQVFLLPSQYHIGFGSNPETDERFPPFTELLASWETGELVWTLCGQPLTPDKMKPLSKELFGDLIR